MSPSNDEQRLKANEPLPTAPSRRSKAFRDGLLAKLPRLGEPSWETKDALNVYDDMAGLAELSVDSFLELLAPLVKSANE
jgi:hypothetical protein